MPLKVGHTHVLNGCHENLVVVGPVVVAMPSSSSRAVPHPLLGIQCRLEVPLSRSEVMQSRVEITNCRPSTSKPNEELDACHPSSNEVLYTAEEDRTIQ